MESLISLAVVHPFFTSLLVPRHTERCEGVKIIKILPVLIPCVHIHPPELVNLLGQEAGLTNMSK
jgi:hypothetical protein